jgi:hypothetical protein
MSGMLFWSIMERTLLEACHTSIAVPRKPNWPLIRSHITYYHLTSTLSNLRQVLRRILGLSSWVTQINSAGRDRTSVKLSCCTHFSDLHCGTFNEFTEWLIVLHQSFRELKVTSPTAKQTQGLLIQIHSCMSMRELQKTASSISPEFGPIPCLSCYMSLNTVPPWPTASAAYPVVNLHAPFPVVACRWYSPECTQAPHHCLLLLRRMRYRLQLCPESVRLWVRNRGRP